MAISGKIEGYRNELLNLLFLKSFRFSPEPAFRLTSGKMSRFYIDCKKTTLNPRGAFLIGQILFHRIKDLSVCGVGGLTLGADPIALAIALTSSIYDRPIPAFIIRKEPKKHGTQKWIEGEIPEKGGVVVLEDVVTTGGSARKAIDILMQEGYSILGVQALIDREEGGAEFIAQSGTPLESLFTLNDFMKLQEEKGKTS